MHGDCDCRDLGRESIRADRLEEERDALQVKLNAARALLAESPRYAPVPETGFIIRRCENCNGLMELPSQLSQVGLVGCIACTAEKERDALRAIVVIAAKTLNHACDPNGDGDDLGACSELDQALSKLTGAKYPWEHFAVLTRVASKDNG